MANNEIVLDLLEAGEFERAQARRRLADLGGEGVRRQGGQPRRRRGVEVGQERQAALHEPIEGYKKLTPAQIIAGLAQIVDELGLPHPLHLHCNNLGVPGQRRHHARDDEGAGGATARTWRTCSSTPTAATTGARCARRRSQIAEDFNAHPNLTTDAGAVLFGDAVTITADGPWQHLLYQLTGRKWGNLDVENETGCGIVPYVYKDQQPRQRRAVGGRARAAAAHQRSRGGSS